MDSVFLFLSFSAATESQVINSRFNVAVGVAPSTLNLRLFQHLHLVFIAKKAPKPVYFVTHFLLLSQFTFNSYDKFSIKTGT